MDFNRLQCAIVQFHVRIIPSITHIALIVTIFRYSKYMGCTLQILLNILTLTNHVQIVYTFSKYKNSAFEPPQCRVQ